MSVSVAVAKGAARDAKRRAKVAETESTAKARYEALVAKIEAIAEDVAAIKAEVVTPAAPAGEGG